MDRALINKNLKFYSGGVKPGYNKHSLKKRIDKKTKTKISKRLKKKCYAMHSNLPFIQSVPLLDFL